MRNRTTIGTWMLGLAVVTLAAAGSQLGSRWFQRVEARAESGSANSTCYTGVGVLGLAAGQELRVSLGTVSGGDIAWGYRISDADNRILFESERIAVPAGQWRYSTVSRENLNIVGEPETGRVQVMVQLGIRGDRSTKAADIINSLEVIEDGRTAIGSSNTIDAFFNFGCSNAGRDCPPPPPV